MKTLPYTVLTGIFQLTSSMYYLVIIFIQFIYLLLSSSTSTGGWVSDGIIAEFIDDTTVRCLSSHLTSFSVLVDVTGTFSETNETVDETEILALSRISYIGTSISILCLLATVIYLLTLRYSKFTMEFSN